jgi:predicted HTH domain antitoxin
MPVVIPDETLREAGLIEREAVVVEIASRLYDAGKLALWPAAKLAEMSRVEFEQELVDRKIPVYRPTLQDLADDHRHQRYLAGPCAGEPGAARTPSGTLHGGHRPARGRE